MVLAPRIGREADMYADFSLLLLSVGVATVIVLAYWLGVEVGKDRGN